MPYLSSRQLLPTAIALLLPLSPSLQAADTPPSLEQELIIETGSETPDIVIEEAGQPASADSPALVIEEGGEATAKASELPSLSDSSGTSDATRFRIDDARLEYGRFTRSDSEADHSGYAKLSAVANWNDTDSPWELQLAARVDAFNDDEPDASTRVDADYGDSFVRYRGDNLKVTLGTQTVIWGRLDELPLSDRVSTVDLTRGLLDELDDRRRSNPMLRAETFVAGGRLDMVWLFDFRAAELPDRQSVWYPVNTRTGRILGVDPTIVAPAAVQNATVIDDEPGGDGGFGLRYTRAHSFADIGVTLANTRQSTPYFRVDGPGRFVAEYPRSWAYGIDAAIDAAGATWRAEVLYSEDNPITRRDLSYTTTPAISWGAGVEFHPGDGDTRVNLQLIGANLIDAGAVVDRKEVYSLNGEVEAPFDHERWRAKVRFYAGLEASEFYVNPELAFLGWEPHEVYVAVHYFDGDDETLGGFYEDNSSINVGWRGSF